MSGDHIDQEKGIKDNGSSDSAVGRPEPTEFVDTAPRGSWTRRVIDSFKRDPNATIIKEAVSRGLFDYKSAAENTANTGLASI